MKQTKLRDFKSVRLLLMAALATFLVASAFAGSEASCLVQSTASCPDGSQITWVYNPCTGQSGTSCYCDWTSGCPTGGVGCGNPGTYSNCQSEAY